MILLPILPFPIGLVSIVLGEFARALLVSQYETSCALFRQNELTGVLAVCSLFLQHDFVGVHW